MLQAVSTNSISALPPSTGQNGKMSRRFPAGHSAEIIDLHDFFVKPPATSLQAAKERLIAELPPKPDCSGMEDWQVMQAMWDWLRMKDYVYQTVLFG